MQVVIGSSCVLVACMARHLLAGTNKTNAELGSNAQTVLSKVCLVLVHCATVLWCYQQRHNMHTEAG